MKRERELAAALRRAYPGALVRVLAKTRDLQAAEDALQDAMERALLHWPKEGLPDSPQAWLVTVASRRHIDQLRQGQREERGSDVLAQLAQTAPYQWSSFGASVEQGAWDDELLRLMFMCCHPSLATVEAAALTLSTVIGLSTPEVAQAFVVGVRTMEQRLHRARKRLREIGAPELPLRDALPERLDAVTCALHLLFNEGYWSSDEQSPLRRDLCELANGLARGVYRLLPEPEVAGLLALFELHLARFEARLDAQGQPLRLPDQDRSRWDNARIAAAEASLQQVLSLGQAGPFQIEAAIAAVHCSAGHADQTDWPQVAALYEILEEYRPTAPVRINRTFAVFKADGAQAALPLLCDGRADVDTLNYSYGLWVRGLLHEALGDPRAAAADLERALPLARNPSERAQLEVELRRLRGVVPAAG